MLALSTNLAVLAFSTTSVVRVLAGLTIAQRVVPLDSMPSRSAGVDHCLTKRTQLALLRFAAYTLGIRSSAFCEGAKVRV